MKHFFTACVVMIFMGTGVHAQVIPPYYQNFDTGSAVGWVDSSQSFTIPWQLGAPTYTEFASNLPSAPNAYTTTLNGNYAAGGYKLLTPVFDLSGQGQPFYMSFTHLYNLADGIAWVESSVDGGNTWQTMSSGTAYNSVNWYTNINNYWDGNSATAIKSMIRLDTFSGYNSVQFRFNVEAYSGGTGGWMVDNFFIDHPTLNLQALQADTISHISVFMPSLTLTVPYAVNSVFYASYPHVKIDYYLSADTILDAGDQLIDSFYESIFYQPHYYQYSFNQTLPMPAGVHTGVNYILYKFDVNDTMPETTRLDNVSYAVIQFDTTIFPPINDGFDSADALLKPLTGPGMTTTIWQNAPGILEHIEYTHAGAGAWATNLGFSTAATVQYYLESPFINLKDYGQNAQLGFWYQANEGGSYVSASSYQGETLQWNFLAQIPANRDDEWDYVLIPLTPVDTGRYMKFQFNYNAIGVYYNPSGMIMDDLYLGAPLPDLDIEREKISRFSSTSDPVYDLKYLYYNAGGAPAASVPVNFYWSTDTILDAGDIFLGTHQEPAMHDTARIWDSITITKPTTDTGVYYIFYKIDTGDIVTESHKYNNTGYFKLHQEPEVTLPYANDFENGSAGWYTYATLGTNQWAYGVPYTAQCPPAYSGTKAWSVQHAPDLITHSRSHLATPVFNLSNAQHPVLECELGANTGYGSYPDGQVSYNMSYSEDGGATWTVLDTSSYSYNIWYYQAYYDAIVGNDDVHNFGTYSDCLMNRYENTFYQNPYNGRDCANNTRMVLDITPLAGKRAVQFRVNADIYDQTVASITFDDFKVAEQGIDLAVTDMDSLLLGDTGVVSFNMNVSNTGNYAAGRSMVKFYVSVDSVWDASDPYIGEDSVWFVLPDRWQHLSESFKGPANLSQYHYLIYHLDADSQLVETNTANNVGAWPLLTNYISAFPYLNDFSNTILTGWHGYCLGTGLGFRFRNKAAPGEILNTNQGNRPNELFTDQTNDIGANPLLYIETPAFDFTNQDSVTIDFDIDCIGTGSPGYVFGGNMEYTTDGGLTWQLLDDRYNTATNWYNLNEPLADIDQDGWSGTSTTFMHATNNISYLARQKVRFRYQYHSNDQPYGLGFYYGMKVDNFQLTTHYSPLPVSVNDPGAGSMSAQITGNKLQVTFDNYQPEFCKLQIYNVLGQRIEAAELSTQTGTQYYNINMQQSGISFVTVTTERYVTTIPVVTIR